MKKKEDKFFVYRKKGLEFVSNPALNVRTLYAPLCGPGPRHLKSAITPFLSGDIKIDKETFFSKPTSREDLRQELRAFFVRVNGKVISLIEEKAPGHVEIGPLWHKLVRKFPRQGIEMEALNFIPVSGENVELMRVTIKNISSRSVKMSAIGAVPIFARALSNKHDHEHVTSLLNRIYQMKEGVLVEPVMKFDEEGHRENHTCYFVFGAGQQGSLPAGSYPTVDDFVGDGGTLRHPHAVYDDRKPSQLRDTERHGKDAMGALRFSEVIVKPGKAVSYNFILGVAANKKDALSAFKKFNTSNKIEAAWEKNKIFWHEKSHVIEIKTGDEDYDKWFQWVTIQPVLRRIFGCSFLPDHDYGKGGKGWRDIWQDLLSLILIEPRTVRDSLINNFAGVRIDGSNATIIGSKPGEFIADRNKITRVWMDHGVWPLTTLGFYMQQTGDLDILLEKQTYFRDRQLSRTFRKDDQWDVAYGNRLKDKNGKIHEGTLLEHILVQHLVQFFNVGEHNIIRLENADWNDGLDMGFDRGESVAFMSFYGGNLLSIADLLEDLEKKRHVKNVVVAKELLTLLDSISRGKINYDDYKAKRKHLELYFKTVEPVMSGREVTLSVADLTADLRLKGRWIFQHIRKSQKIRVGKTTWFNGYYDNKGKRVEGKHEGALRMTLTGQVFAIMSGMATDEDIKEIINAVNGHLKDKKWGGFRLNTDFKRRTYLDLGRAFGFAYGTKENGAFFSHMIVMYAYALYSRGFAREGYKVLQSIYKMACAPQAKIYPGIPEYFDSEGRGMYHYLTGSASWLVLTQLTQVFGIRGHQGDLLLAPKLVKEEFDQQKRASVHCFFAGKPLFIEYNNPDDLDVDQYRIRQVLINGNPVQHKNLHGRILIDRSTLLRFNHPSHLRVFLQK